MGVTLGKQEDQVGEDGGGRHGAISRRPGCEKNIREIIRRGAQKCECV